MPLSLSFGKNNLSAWLYGKESTKGLIIVAPGHSLGDYAVTAVLNFPHRIDAVVSSSGFNSEKEQWECSIKRFTGPGYRAAEHNKSSLQSGTCFYRFYKNRLT